MCVLQYYDPCSWDNYSPDGIQSQYEYGLSDQEANYFGKKEKERKKERKKGRKREEDKGMTRDAFDIADLRCTQDACHIRT